MAQEGKKISTGSFAQYRYQALTVFVFAIALAVFVLALRSIQQSFEHIVLLERGEGGESARFQLESLYPIAERLRLDQETLQPLPYD